MTVEITGVTIGDHPEMGKFSEKIGAVFLKSIVVSSIVEITAGL
ncbi:MAG: hypothetical protein PHV74_12300 [Dehalococcoidia bacterium]|nr:hypothetical protein [Dehalococcoidia bacterium]